MNDQAQGPRQGAGYGPSDAQSGAAAGPQSTMAPGHGQVGAAGAAAPGYAAAGGAQIANGPSTGAYGQQQAAGPMDVGPSYGPPQSAVGYGGPIPGVAPAFQQPYQPTAHHSVQPGMPPAGHAPAPDMASAMAWGLPYAQHVAYSAAQPGMAYHHMYQTAPLPPGMGAPPNAVPGGAATAVGHGRQAGMSQIIEELANGGNGLASLGRMLNLEDSEFWKGALVGAAAVLLLTNDSVQDVLFKTGAKAKEAVQSGASKLKQTAADAADKATS